MVFVGSLHGCSGVDDEVVTMWARELMDKAVGFWKRQDTVTRACKEYAHG